MPMKYSKLATDDDDRLDFQSIYKYDSVHEYNSESNYKSVFKYSKQKNYNYEITTSTTNTSNSVKRYCELLVIFFAYCLFAITLPYSACFFIKKLKHYERYVIFRLGHIHSCRGPGFTLRLPFIDQAVLVDLRPKAFSVPPQKILTIDGAIIEIGADIYYKVKDAISSVSCIKDIQHSIRQLALTLIQKQVSTVENITSSKMKAVADQLKDEMNSMTLQWGIAIDKIEMSTIKILQEPSDNALNNIEGPMKILSSIFCPTDSKQSNVNSIVGQFMNINNMRSPEEPAKDIKSNVAAETLMKMVKPVLNEKFVADFQVAYNFKLIDNDESISCYHLDLKNGSGSVGPGPIVDTDVTLTLQSNDLHKLITGDISIFSAYMTGRIEVEGELNKASKLSELLKLITDK